MKLSLDFSHLLPLSQLLPRRAIVFGAGIFLAATSVLAPAAPIKTETLAINLVTVTEGLKNPWGLAFLPDGRMLTTEREGHIRIITAAGDKGPALEGLPNIIARGQGGLLDVEVAPDFAQSKRIYFAYSEPAEKGKANSTAVAYGTLNGNKLENVTRVFSQQPKVESTAHFGSRILFTPDGNMFVTLGDRYLKMDDAQTLDNHNGKIVRIKPDGSVPDDNPYVKNEKALAEIWSIGHRNVQGAALHPVTGDLWTGEHGPQGGDEVNITQASKNYGWPIITYGENYGGGKIGIGTHKEGMEQPIYKWVPSIAIAGMTFYTGDKFPQWKNNLLVTSLRGKALARLVIKDNKVIHEERLLEKQLNQRLRDVVQGPDGFIYVLTDEPNGGIYRLEPAPKK